MLRAIQSSAIGGSPAWISEHRNLFDHGFALADLLHRVHGSILEPEFVDNDVTFINFAIPYYLGSLGKEVDPAIIMRFVAIYDAAPVELRNSLTWQPTPDMRAISSRVENIERVESRFPQVLPAADSSKTMPTKKPWWRFW